MQENYTASEQGKCNQVAPGYKHKINGLNLILQRKSCFTPFSYRKLCRKKVTYTNSSLKKISVFLIVMETPIFQNAIRIIPSTDELPEDTELWRYMRLSTFLMLLRGKLFVPTIAELRRDDPIEARSICAKTRSYFDNLSKGDRDWLLSHAKKTERTIIDHADTQENQKARIFKEIWDRELEQRRRIWCWHHADIESMALWHIYAREGIAIQSTPARIKEAFPSSVDTALIARVAYIDHARQEALDHHFMRPYLLKQRCYSHEKEVRVIFPRDSDDPDGHRLLSIDPFKLIKQIWISPHIPRSEALEVRRSLILAWRNGSEFEDHNNDPGIFLSNSKTVFESQWDEFALHQCEQTGITNFGSFTMPFVMCGDFAPM